jgi:hypothetical protein
MFASVGFIVVIIASFIHCWYAANKAAYPGNRAGGYMRFGQLTLILSILLLFAGVSLIWLGSSLLVAIVAVAIYFFVLPLLIMPLMKKIYISAPSQKMSDDEWEKIAGLHDNSPRFPTSTDFWTQLFLLIQDASEHDAGFVDVNAGKLHRSVGGYPSDNHRMPLCCGVMREEMQPGDVILQEPPKGTGASLTIRYFLPRASTKSLKAT